MLRWFKFAPPVLKKVQPKETGLDGMAEEIAPGVFLLSLPEPSCNAYFLKEGKAVVDPGMSDAGVLEKELGRAGSSRGEVRAVFLTHCHLDHVFNLKWLENAVVYCGAETLEALRGRKEALFPEIEFELPKNKVVVVKDGQKIRVGGSAFKCFAAPGHTRDSACFLKKASGILFSGDALFPTASSGALPRIFEGGSAVELRRTYEKLEKSGARALASGHYPFSGEFGKEIRAAIRLL